MTKRIEGLERARYFWAIVYRGSLVVDIEGTPYLYATKDDALECACDGVGCKPVRVIVLVEDE